MQYKTKFKELTMSSSAPEHTFTSSAFFASSASSNASTARSKPTVVTLQAGGRKTTFPQRFQADSYTYPNHFYGHVKLRHGLPTQRLRGEGGT